jgi:hypothetical protein
MKALAGALSCLSPDVDRPVFDMTGLTGVVDVTFDLETEDKPATDGWNREGGPAEILVIDHAVKASDN